MTPTEVHWVHNDGERRWELGYEDPVDKMVYGKSWVLLSYVTDEFLAHVAMSREVIRDYILARFKVQLPDEAYPAADDLRNEGGASA